jgi:hypothetical protein
MTKTPKARKSPESKSRKYAADDPAQYERFRAFAREHETDESTEAFDSTFTRLVNPNPISHARRLK